MKFTQLNLFPTPNRIVTPVEAVEHFAKLKADVAAMEFQTDLCRVGNFGWTSHKFGIRVCSRCQQPVPKISLPDKQ